MISDAKNAKDTEAAANLAIFQRQRMCQRAHSKLFTSALAVFRGEDWGVDVYSTALQAEWIKQKRNATTHK